MRYNNGMETGKKRGLKGHRRIVKPVGESTGTRTPPTGGYDVGCICGWTGGNCGINRLAQLAYKAHLDHLIDECPFECTRCGLMKPATEMRPDHRYVCLKCFSQSGRDWQAKHPAETRRHKRHHQLKKDYGVGIEHADALLAEQDGKCAICQIDISNPIYHTPHLDHDHATGKLRGLLCVKCNLGLGAFKDRQAILSAAIAYLDKWGCE